MPTRVPPQGSCWMVMYLVNDGKSAYATLPTQQKSTLLPRVPTHAYADCIIAGQQPKQLYKEFARIHDAGHSKKRCSPRNSSFVELKDGNLLHHPPVPPLRNALKLQLPGDVA